MVRSIFVYSSPYVLLLVPTRPSEATLGTVGYPKPGIPSVLFACLAKNGGEHWHSSPRRACQRTQHRSSRTQRNGSGGAALCRTTRVSVNPAWFGRAQLLTYPRCFHTRFTRILAVGECHRASGDSSAVRVGGVSLASLARDWTTRFNHSLKQAVNS